MFSGRIAGVALVMKKLSVTFCWRDGSRRSRREVNGPDGFINRGETERDG